MAYPEKSRKYNGWCRLPPVSIYLSLWSSLHKRCYFHKLALQTFALASLNTFGSIIGHQQLMLSLPFSHLQLLLTHLDFQLMHLSCTAVFACLSLSSSITVTCSINNFCVWLGPAFLSWQLPQKPWVIPPSRAGLLPRPGVSFLGTLAWRTLGSYHYLYLSFTLFSLLPLDLDLNLILFARLGRVPVSCSLLFIDVIALFISDECPYWFLAFTLSSFYSFYYWLL
jgi:hypothetical protein